MTWLVRVSDSNIQRSVLLGARDSGKAYALVELHGEHAIESVTGRNHLNFFACILRVD